MKRLAIAIALGLAASAAARADLVSELWGGPDGPCTHPGTLKVLREGQAPRLVFDLSALPKGATIYRASLVCFLDGEAQPVEPVQIFEVESLGEGGRAAHRGPALRLEPPLYGSFDATEAVRRWVKDPGANLGFVVERFERMDAPRTCLEVRYEGKAAKLPPQVTDLRAVHHDGQTFLAWKEVPDYRPRPESVVWVDKWDEKGDRVADGPGTSASGLPRVPAIRLKDLRELQGLGLRDKPSGFQGIKPLQRVLARPAVRYRVYRHTEKITPANLRQAERIGEALPLSAYDEKMKMIEFKGEYIDQLERGDALIPTWCLEDGKAVLPGEAVYVHAPTKPGSAYYAVTSVLAGTENAAEVGAASSLAAPVREEAAPPRPVLQFIQNDQYVDETPERWYVFWAAPPYYNRPSTPLHVTVGAPKDFKGPGPMYIKAPSMGGDFNLRGDMNVPSRTAVTLMIEQHIPWGTDLCFNEGRGTLRALKECQVDYFSERYMLHVIQWALGQWSIDRTKISGSMLHFGIRHPEIFAKMDFGAYTVSYDVRWAPGSGGLAGLLGPKGSVRTEDADDAWEVFNIGWYLRKYPARDIPYLVCISAVGKDVGHTSEFGWQDDPRGWRALLDARQTFVATWGTEQGRAWQLHPEMAQEFNRMRWDVTLPAFSHCSLDDNPGNGDPADGDPCGQINGYLLWEDAGQVDGKDRWEATVYLVSTAPSERCTVDITPRHCREFKPRPGEKFKWTNTSEGAGKLIQSGEVAADQWGLVSLPKVIVEKGKNRIAISR